jgi:hypothetical protein
MVGTENQQIYMAMTLPIDVDPETFDMDAEKRYKQVLTFKDFVGFRKIMFIKERYRIDQILGEGSFGTVRKAYHLHAKIDVAIKFIKKADIKNDEQKKNL